MKRLLLFILFLAAATYCRADAILTISPTSQTVALGSQVSVNVGISGLGNGTALGAYDLNVEFDPTVLAYDGIAFGNQLDIFGLGDIQFVTPDAGTVDVFELSLDSSSDLESLQQPAFVLATLTFDTLSTGINSSLALTVNALSDADGNSVDSSVSGGSVSVNAAAVAATPEPCSLVLCLTGFLAIAGSLLNCRRNAEAQLITKWSRHA